MKFTEHQQQTIREMYLNGATDSAIAYATNSTVNRVRQCVKSLGLPLRQPQKSKSYINTDLANQLRQVTDIHPRTATSRINLARKMDAGTEPVTQVNLRRIGATAPALKELRKTLLHIGADVDASGKNVKLLAPGKTCTLTFVDLCFLVAGPKGIQSLSQKINATWVDNRQD